MDEARAARIEGLLDGIVRDMLPRREFERRIDKLESRVGHALDRIATAEAKVSFLEPTVADLGGRMNDVEEATDALVAVHGAKEKRKGWIVPALVSGLGVAVNATLTAITFALSNSHHSG